MKAKRRRKKAKGKAEGFLLGRDVQNVTGAGARLAKAPSVFDARARASARAGPPKPPKEDTNPPDALLEVPVLRDFLRTWSRKAGGGRALSAMKKELLVVLHAVVEVAQDAAVQAALKRGYEEGHQDAVEGNYDPPWED